MTTYNDTLSEYITDLFATEDAALQTIRETIQEKGLPAIHIKPEEGRFLQCLTRACDTVKALEIGTLGGYSGVWIARGLAPGGRLITLEKEPKHAEVARDNFEIAGVADQVEVLVGPALELLPSLTGEAPFDFVFIDAAKSEYQQYFDWALKNVRMGGTIVAHNAFRQGDIVEKEGEEMDPGTEAIRVFNRHVAEEPDVISTIYPAGDGMVVAVKVAPTNPI
ncbi:MAG: O-methyltransferase [Chloroflexota bacterium]|nr:O-methyltransferase [Chloroflexota bacterium]